MRLRAALIACLAMASPSWAGTVEVRSGEHPGFTRLVVAGAGPGEWTLGRTNSGYGLRLPEPADIDLTQAFRLIGRDRVAALDVDPDRRGLLVTLGCDCHAEAFRTEAGLLVVDIRDGKPKAGSAFENPLVTEVAPQAPLAPLVRPDHQRPKPVDPQIGFFWRRVVADASATGTREPASAQPPAPGILPGVEEERAHAALPPAAAPPESRATEPVPPEAAEAEAGGTEAPSDPASRTAEAELRSMLDRAAMQGVVELDDERIGKDQTPKGSRPADVGGGEPPIRGETVYDRDTPRGKLAVPATENPCPDDAPVDLAAWSDDRPAWLQIAEARAGLVGEFDRPDPDSVRKLVRLYLALGMGDEARATLEAFESDSAEAPLVAGLAEVIDDRPQQPDSPLAGWIGCKGPAALWALLAHPDPAAAKVDVGSVLLAFSALSPAMRDILGPRLAERFLLRGDPAAARMVSDAIDRHLAGPAPDSLVAARIDLAVGEEDMGRAEIERLAMADDQQAPQALVLALDRRLAAGDPVTPEMVETAAVYAQERKGTPLGFELRRVEIIGRAASGDFATARALLDAAADLPGPTQVDALTGFLAELAQRADDATFLTNAFALGGRLGDAPSRVPLRLLLARRLVDLGLPDEAASLAGPALGTEEARDIDVRLALARQDGDAALRALDGAEGPEWLELRARAEALLGRHDRAAQALAEAGNIDASVSESWRAADWARVARDAPPGQKAELEALGLVSPQNTAPPAGPLAEGRGGVETSRSLRSAVASMIATD